MSKKFGNCAIKTIELFITEIEQSDMAPTLIIMSKNYLESLKKYYPYMVENGFYLHRKDRIRIVTTDEDFIGAGLCYFIDNMQEDLKTERNG